MRLQLQRGVPPLFTTLKPLYKDHERVRVIGQVVEEFLSSLNRQSKFSDEGGIFLIRYRLLFHLSSVNCLQKKHQFYPQLLSCHNARDFRFRTTAAYHPALDKLLSRPALGRYREIRGGIGRG